MSKRYFSSAQQNIPEAPVSPNPSETQQSVAEIKEKITPIRTRHVLMLGGLIAFAPLSTDMYLPALPTISRDLGATMTQAQLTLTACILGLSLGQVVIGPISDAL